MTALGSRLAVFNDERECDKHPGHAIDIVTDGTVAIVTTADRYAAGAVYRDGTEIHVTCGAPDKHEEPCDGTATFELGTDHWTADPKLLANLASFGQAIES